MVAQNLDPSITQTIEYDEIPYSLYRLANAQLLDAPGWDNEEGPKYTITPRGIFEFKKHLAPLATSMKNSKSYDKILNSVVGDPKVKDEMKKFRTKFKDKVEEQIVEGLIQEIIKIGPQALTYILRIIAIGSPI